MIMPSRKPFFFFKKKIEAQLVFVTDVFVTDLYLFTSRNRRWRFNQRWKTWQWLIGWLIWVHRNIRKRKLLGDYCELKENQTLLLSNREQREW
jgi:hypothetical protein